MDSLEPLGTPSRLAASNSSKFDVFNHPDSDDPVAQTLYKMIEPDDKVGILCIQRISILSVYFCIL